MNPGRLADTTIPMSDLPGAGAGDEVVVPAALDGQRLDRVVALLTGVTRADAAELVAGGHVSVEGKPVKTKTRRLAEGEAFFVDTTAIPDRVAKLEPDSSVAIEVVYDDEDVIVVDKPAGLVVHPGAGNETGTLVQGLIARYPDMMKLAVAGAEQRPGVVQRLDVGTSGLLVVARSERAYESLVDQLQARTVERRYTALVAGIVASDEGVVDAPIGRSSSDPTRQAVVADGRAARTHYKVLARYQRLERSGAEPQPFPATLLDCRLETGRTHQIRVHLAAIGHPVVGDTRYGGRQRRSQPLGPESRSRPLGPQSRSRPLGPEGQRPFLHAHVLGFEHPSGRHLHFESELSADLTAWIECFSPSAPGSETLQ